MATSQKKSYAPVIVIAVLLAASYALYMLFNNGKLHYAFGVAATILTYGLILFSLFFYFSFNYFILPLRGELPKITKSNSLLVNSLLAISLATLVFLVLSYLAFSGENILFSFGLSFVFALIQALSLLLECVLRKPPGSPGKV